ncbi:hypothetical protein GCM10011395_16610 [Sphingomonas psychrolutea]|uniref:Uncharacterized protein n=1 Tax=Sphingomonas psychrolutea TaxID=1259676 RepID=A0ABQ1GNH0_9SPHN|nr:hypothetical protein GCM10011395_16610 [Sphingomonas psychrolutea]
MTPRRIAISPVRAAPSVAWMAKAKRGGSVIKCPIPFALSLSKAPLQLEDVPCGDRGFDKLSPNGKDWR